MNTKLHCKYPVFVMSGGDPQRRKLLETIDPDERYKSKALLPFLGKRLIDWQLEALNRSPYIEGLYLIGLSAEDASFNFPVHYVPGATTAEFADKLIAGISYLSANEKNPSLVVISSCDTPGIQTQHINQFFEKLNALPESEFVLSLVPEHLIEAAFPHSKRVVLGFRDIKLVPGELYALSPRAIREGYKLISEISTRRRKIDRQAHKINPMPVIRLLAQKPLMWGLILKYLLGKATMSEAERVFSKTFGYQTRGVIISDAGFGMDLDLPEDYERLKTYLNAQVNSEVV
jgi:GTP:adenosylcobinamide-phosphate guanylyltransferase